MSYSHREVFLSLFTPVRETPSQLLDICSGPMIVQAPPWLQEFQSHLQHRIGQCKNNVMLWAQTGELKRGERWKGEEKKEGRTTDSHKGETKRKSRDVGLQWNRKILITYCP